MHFHTWSALSLYAGFSVRVFAGLMITSSICKIYDLLHPIPCLDIEVLEILCTFFSLEFFKCCLLHSVLTMENSGAIFLFFCVWLYFVFICVWPFIIHCMWPLSISGIVVLVFSFLKFSLNCTVLLIMLTILRYVIYLKSIILKNYSREILDILFWIFND